MRTLTGPQVNAGDSWRDAERTPLPRIVVLAIGEVVEQAGLRTAWSDKHLSYEVLDGPSGVGVDDRYDPEIAAVDDESFVAVAAAVPAIFGMNFQAVSVWQKASGYVDGIATPSADVQTALADVDASLGRIVDELNRRGLWSSTAMVITRQPRSIAD